VKSIPAKASTAAVDAANTIKDNKELMCTMNRKGELPVFGIHNYNLIDLGHKTKTTKTIL
jgi:hypothetical protein